MLAACLMYVKTNCNLRCLTGGSHDAAALARSYGVCQTYGEPLTWTTEARSLSVGCLPGSPFLADVRSKEGHVQHMQASVSQV